MELDGGGGGGGVQGERGVRGSGSAILVELASLVAFGDAKRGIGLRVKDPRVVESHRRRRRRRREGFALSLSLSGLFSLILWEREVNKVGE